MSMDHVENMFVNAGYVNVIKSLLLKTYIFYSCKIHSVYVKMFLKITISTQKKTSGAAFIAFYTWR